MAKPYQYADDIYIGGPKLSNWRLRLLFRDHEMQRKQHYTSWKVVVLPVALMVLSTVAVLFMPPEAWPLAAAIVFIFPLLCINIRLGLGVNILMLVIALITPFPDLVKVVTVMMPSILVTLAVMTIVACGLLLDSRRVARKQTGIRYWSKDPALVLLARLFEDKGGDEQWLRQEAAVNADITKVIDTYIEASGPLVTEFPSDWQSRRIDQASLERGRSSLEIVIRAASELADFVMLTYSERQDAAAKVESEQLAYQKAHQDFLETQEAKLKQQKLQMAESDVNSFIEGLSYQRRQGIHHS